MFGRKKPAAEVEGTYAQNVDPLAEIPKSRWERIWPAMACGSGLFSDGYINNVRYQLLVDQRLQVLTYLRSSVPYLQSSRNYMEKHIPNLARKRTSPLSHSPAPFAAC
jgi:hypothetical protein